MSEIRIHITFQHKSLSRDIITIQIIASQSKISEFQLPPKISEFQLLILKHSILSVLINTPVSFLTPYHFSFQLLILKHSILSVSINTPVSFLTAKSYRSWIISHYKSYSALTPCIESWKLSIMKVKFSNMTVMSISLIVITSRDGTAKF